MKDNLDCESHR